MGGEVKRVTAMGSAAACRAAWDGRWVLGAASVIWPLFPCARKKAWGVPERCGGTRPLEIKLRWEQRD